MIMPYIYFKEGRKSLEMAEGGREHTKEKSVSKV